MIRDRIHRKHKKKRLNLLYDKCYETQKNAGFVKDGICMCYFKSDFMVLDNTSLYCKFCEYSCWKDSFC